MCIIQWFVQQKQRDTWRWLSYAITCDGVALLLIFSWYVLSPFPEEPPLNNGVVRLFAHSTRLY